MLRQKFSPSNMQVPPPQRPITNAMSQLTQGWDTGDQQKFLSRIGNWFRRSANGVEQVEHQEEVEPQIPIDDIQTGGDGPSDPEPEPRVTFLRPWAKRDQAIENLNRGI